MFLGIRPGLWTLTIIAVIAAAIGVLASRRVDEAGKPGRRRVAAFLFAALFAAGVAAQIHLGARLQSDGFYYFAYLRSIAFDGDVEFSNDYKLLGLGDKAHLFNPTPTGYAQSAWTIGPAIVWAPFFAAAHPIAHRLAAGGADVSTNGVSYPYRQAVCIAGLFYALLGCWFIYRLTTLFFDRRLAAGAVALVISGSFMLWYIVKEPSMTHAPSMAGVAGFVWMWAATHGRRTRVQWALLGLLAGFITLIRWQNALFAILPAYEALTMLVAAMRRRDQKDVTATLTAGAVFTGCAVVGFVPQMIAWKSIYGSFLAVSPVGPQIRWWDPQLVDILWSARNGLFSWSPILYLGAIGLVMFAIARPWIGVPALLSIGVMTYFNASIQDWWGSAGYGGRRFEGTLPLFALGVAAFVQAMTGVVRRHPLRTVGVGRCAARALESDVDERRAGRTRPDRRGDLVRRGRRPPGAGVPPLVRQPLHLSGQPGIRTAQRSADRFVRPAVIATLSRRRTPSLRTHRHRQRRRTLARGRLARRGRRWRRHVPLGLLPCHVTDRAGPCRTAARPGPRPGIQLPGAAPQMMTPVVNGKRYAPVLVPPEWTTVVFDVEADAWRAGVNRLTLEFGRTERPADVGLGGDGRLLSAAIDYVRVEVIR